MKAASLPFIPGVMTPGEVMHRREQGFRLMKLLPAQQAGGPGMLKALGGPIPDVMLCPAGGVSPENLKDYLNLPNVAMAGGSWLTPSDALANVDWKKIARLVREATLISHG